MLALQYSQIFEKLSQSYVSDGNYIQKFYRFTIKIDTLANNFKRPSYIHN